MEVLSKFDRADIILMHMFLGGTAKVSKQTRKRFTDNMKEKNPDITGCLEKYMEAIGRSENLMLRSKEIKEKLGRDYMEFYKAAYIIEQCIHKPYQKLKAQESVQEDPKR